MGLIVKCLTLWQPYASLVACGAKRIETRSWGTSYRGTMLIHASKKWNNEIADDCKRCMKLLDDHGFKCGGRHSLVLQLPWGGTLGKVMARCRLIDCRPMLAPPEGTFDRHFGFFGDGRYGWMMDRIEPVFPPVPLIGHQGLFDVDESIIAGSMMANADSPEWALPH